MRKVRLTYTGWATTTSPADATATVVVACSTSLTDSCHVSPLPIQSPAITNSQFIAMRRRRHECGGGQQSRRDTNPRITTSRHHPLHAKYRDFPPRDIISQTSRPAGFPSKPPTPTHSRPPLATAWQRCLVFQVLPKRHAHQFQIRPRP